MTISKRASTMMVAVAAAMVAPQAAALDPPEPVWVRTLDPGGMDLGEGVAVDADGNVFVVGIADDDGNQNVLVARLTPEGELAWTRVVDEGERDRGEGAAATARGVVVAGTVRTAGGDDAVVSEYDREGSLLWTMRLDKGTSETARAVAVDPDGNVLVAGASLSMNGADGFVAKLTSEGEEVWAKPINLFFVDEAFGVCADHAGNVVVAGRVLREAQFDLFARKLTPAGAVVWTRFVSTPVHEEGRGVACDRHGNAYVTGTTVTRSGNATHRDALVVKLAPDGETLWTRTLDLAGAHDDGRGAWVDPGGNALVTGFGVVDGSKEPFLVKLTPQGEEVYRHVWTGAGVDGAGRVAASPDGSRVALVGAAQRNGSDFDHLVLVYDQGAPMAGFRLPAGEAEAGRPVRFEDASAPGGQALQWWTWDFGDGGSSTASNPEHVYERPGTYVVRLTVRDAYHNVGTATRTLVVTGDPPATGSAPGGDGGDGGGSTPGAVEESGTSDAPAPSAAALVAAAGVAAWLARRRR